MRYKADPEPFEWLRSYAELRSWIQDASGNNTSASKLPALALLGGFCTVLVFTNGTAQLRYPSSGMWKQPPS